MPQSKLISSSSVYIKTDQIDGETDLKLRKPYPKTQETFKQNKPIFSDGVEFQINLTNHDINDFEGTIHYIDEGRRAIIDRDPLGVENTIWSGCSVNKSEVLGLIIAVGEETRLVKNSKNVRHQKRTSLDEKVNLFSLLLFIIMVTISVINALIQGSWRFGVKNFAISVSRFVILLSFLIPISLKLFLVIARIGYSNQIATDEEISETICKNESIVDELGKIEIILSDKTGTITKNEMYMDKISVKEQIYDKAVFQQNIEDYYKKKSVKSTKKSVDLSFGLVICNNVNMKISDGKKYFDASSPDEIAMVEYFEELGFEIINRDDKYVKFLDRNKQTHFYEILELFPFESSKKRMGIIVKNIGDNEHHGDITFYIKGADVVMKSKIHNVADKLVVEENTLLLASEGLRTLCFTKKIISESDLDTYRGEYKANVLNGNKETNKILLNKLEDDLEFLGITAVKDLLQDDVPTSFAYIEQALLKLWILTGDKLETAQHICTSTGLAKRNRPVKLLTVKNDKDLISFYDPSVDSPMIITDCVLMVDGDLLARAFELDKKAFLRSCLSYNYVCFARCTPAQKYNIAHTLKNVLGKRILAIGDGGNDVGMIQVANVGVGIYGKEGNQAALAADFTINKFSYLCKLIFFHGRNAHRGVSSISQFVLHRGLIISWIQETFSLLFFMISMPIFNGLMMAAYSAIFTTFPVLTVIYDVDVPWEHMKDYLSYYIPSGKGVSIKHFLIWCTISVYQAAAIFITSFYLFEEFLANFVGITFTALILAETFNTFFLVSGYSRLLGVSILFTAFLYVCTVILFRGSFDINLFDLKFLYKVTIVFIVTWVPIFIIQRIFRRFNRDVADLVK